MRLNYPLVAVLLVMLLTLIVVTFGWHAAPLVPRQTSQIVIVTTDSWETPFATVRRFERNAPDLPWRAVGGPIHANIGKNGLTVGLGTASAHRLGIRQHPEKYEGDHTTPAGVFRLGQKYGYEPDGSEGKWHYQEVTRDWKGVDDAKSAHYNQVVSAKIETPDWTSAEEMRRDDDLYSRVVVVDHNGGAADRVFGAKPIPGRGSCIFLHVWRGPESPTAGCVSMSFTNMDELTLWLQPSANPVIVILTHDDYRRLADQMNSGLPKF